MMRIEIEGSPLAGLVGDATYEHLLADARERLAVYLDEQGAVALPLDATILSATKA
jgi:hypothetical protein